MVLIRTRLCFPEIQKCNVWCCNKQIWSTQCEDMNAQLQFWMIVFGSILFEKCHPLKTIISCRGSCGGDRIKKQDLVFRVKLQSKLSLNYQSQLMVWPLPLLVWFHTLRAILLENLGGGSCSCSCCCYYVKVKSTPSLALEPWILTKSKNQRKNKNMKE